MNNLFRGILLSQWDEIHEHIQVSLLLGKRTKGSLREEEQVVFTCFCRFSKEAFCRKSTISTGRNGRLKSVKLGNLVEHIGDKTR